MRCLAAALVLLVGLAAPARAAERPRTLYVPADIDIAKVPLVVNSKTIFVNRCKAGCKITQGYTDSRKDTSAIGGGTLSAFSYGDTTWNGLMACMKKTFDRFNVEVTDVDPGPMVDHFEVIVAGSPQQLGLPSYIGGIAESPCTANGVCSKFLPNTLVFTFASVWGNNVNELCATAAQELAHTWTLDHVIDASDPMTYNPYSGMRTFKDGQTCGSDCVQGKAPSGETCVSTATCTSCAHTCMSTGTMQQDNVKILLALFGPAGAQPPTLQLKNPTNGSAQQPGFSIDVECTAPAGIQEVQLTIDGTMMQTKVAPPYSFTAPASLADGPHRVSVLCATKEQAIARVNADVNVGQPCPCAQAGYICFDGACIAGPDAPGGVGATCANNEDCISGTCANDGTTSACVITCDPSNASCPDGFGCVEAGASGVCWLGADGGGCCDTRGGNGAGSLLLALGVTATLITRRRRRTR
jgi:hypothetical protein